MDESHFTTMEQLLFSWSDTTISEPLQPSPAQQLQTQQPTISDKAPESANTTRRNSELVQIVQQDQDAEKALLDRIEAELFCHE